MTAFLVMINSLLLAINIFFIDKSLYSDKVGVSWVNVAAAVFIAGCTGFLIRGEFDR